MLKAWMLCSEVLLMCWEEACWFGKIWMRQYLNLCFVTKYTCYTLKCSVINKDVYFHSICYCNLLELSLTWLHIGAIPKSLSSFKNHQLKRRLTVLNQARWHFRKMSMLFCTKLTAWTVWWQGGEGHYVCPVQMLPYSEFLIIWVLALH